MHTVARKHMDTLYEYLSSADYINNLAFDYVETYSFQRGTDYKENLILISREYERLKVRKVSRDNLSQVEEERFSELHELLVLLNTWSTVKVNFIRRPKK